MEQYTEVLLPVLIKCFAGKIWNGKEMLFDALASICIASKEHFNKQTGLAMQIDSNESTLGQIIHLVISETKKNKIEYKYKAITCLDRLLEHFGSTITIFKEVKEVLFPIMLAQNEKMVISNQEEKEEKKQKISDSELRMVAISTVTKAWPAINSPDYSLLAVELSDSLLQTSHVQPWNIKIEVLKSLSFWLKRLAADGDSISNLFTSDSVSSMLDNIFECLSDLKYSALRKAALDTLLVLVESTKDTTLLSSHEEKIKNQLSSLVTDQQLTTTVGDIKDLLHPSKRKRSS